MVKTLFIDLDGTLVFHNYSPSDVQDEFLPGALEFLENAKSKGYFCILTTNRSQRNCEDVLSKLACSLGFSFDRYMFDLPVGVRILVNDNKDHEVRAVAIALERNAGLEDIEI